MQVQASLHNLRVAPRKVRLVIGLVRGLSLPEARRRLKFLNKAAALPILKLLNSAATNAKAKGLSLESLTIKSILANQGQVLYRYRPRAMGRAATIRKKMTHVMVTLEGQEIEKSKIRNSDSVTRV